MLSFDQHSLEAHRGTTTSQAELRSFVFSGDAVEPWHATMHEPVKCSRISLATIRSIIFAPVRRCLIPVWHVQTSEPKHSSGEAKIRALASRCCIAWLIIVANEQAERNAVHFLLSC